MAEPSTLARPYAEAVFRLADANGKLTEWSGMIGALAMVSEDERVRATMSDPSRSVESVAGVYLSILAGKLTGEAENFVRVLAENRRLVLLPEIRVQFEALRNEREGRVEAKIYSAFPLDAAQLADVVAGLEKRTGHKVSASVQVDEALIGGVRVELGDKVIDASVRGQLSGLATSLKG